MISGNEKFADIEIVQNTTPGLENQPFLFQLPYIFQKVAGFITPLFLQVADENENDKNSDFSGKLPNMMKSGQLPFFQQGIGVDGANNKILGMIRKFRRMMWSLRDETSSSLTPAL